jgi:hypothetical protein
VLRALQIMGLDRLLRIYPTLITALARGSPPDPKIGPGRQG